MQGTGWINVSFEAAYVSVTVGFSPVAPGNSMVTTGVAAGAAEEEGGAPTGFVDALLAMLAQSLTGGELPAGGGQSAGGDTGGGNPPPASQMANLVDVDLALDAALTVPTTSPDVTATAPVTPDAKALLKDLTAALAAIDEAVKNGQPVDPALEKKLNETIDAIAALLGVPVPQQPIVSLQPSTGENLAANVDLDGNLIMENKPLPPGYELPETGDDAAAKPDTKLADDFLKAVEAVKTPVIEEEPAVDETGKPKPKAEGEAIDAETPIGKLVTKLTEVAERLDGKLPEVSAKLEALAQKLASQTIDPETVAKIAAGIDVADLDALLAPKPEAAKPAPAPAQFTTPVLPTPAAVAVPPPKQATDAVKTEPLATAKEPELAKPEDKPVAKDTKPAERPEVDNKPRERNSFAAHLAETRAEKLADQQQAQPTQAAAAQVKTDMGVVAPKAVHAAYQAPVQQINMPQVAFEVVRQFSQGASRFQIRLDPPELGRIDVRMQVDGDGNVHARMTVERAETLDLMQRDQRSLEKALAQAGLDSGKTNLEFSLRQNPFARDGQGQQQQQNGHNPFLRDRNTGVDETAEIASTTTQYRGLASASGVNLFV